MAERGDQPDGPVHIERRSAEETIGLLGDANRVAILRAIGERPDEPVTFGELHDRAGIDDSGQFNYHLNRLVGSFVRKGPEGYELTHAGAQIVGALYAGTYTANATVDPIEIGDPCPLCDGTLVAEYADERAVVACASCEEWRNEFPFPPGSLDQFPADRLPLVWDRWLRLEMTRILAGFCPVCAGRMEGTLTIDADREAMPARAVFSCTRCKSHADMSATMVAADEPEVVAFLHEHGVDARTAPSWTRWGAVDGPVVEAVGEDPPRVEVSYVADDARLKVVIGDGPTVETVRRVAE